MNRITEKIIYVEYEDAAALIYSHTTIYHEDGDKGFHQQFTALEVANRLHAALGETIKNVYIPIGQLGQEWNFDDLQTAAIKLAK